MSMIDPTAEIEITAFEWVLDFARGLVRPAFHQARADQLAVFDAHPQSQPQVA